MKDKSPLLPAFYDPFMGKAAIIVFGGALLVSLALWPFVTHVGRGEIVVEDCDGALSVWRGSKDYGLHWDGLCTTTAYARTLYAPFSEPVEVDDARVRLRGLLKLHLSDDDDAIRAMYRQGVTEGALADEILPAANAEVLDAAGDPAWHRPQGNIVERELKGALEYGIRRLSPTGAIWSTHEAKHALDGDIRRRLKARTFPYGITVEADLGSVTER